MAALGEGVQQSSHLLGPLASIRWAQMEGTFSLTLLFNLPPQGCTGSFTSITGYLYHSQKCGKAAAELEKMALKCHHCSKAYRSKAGLAYHLKSEHGTVSFCGSLDNQGLAMVVSSFHCLPC